MNLAIDMNKIKELIKSLSYTIFNFGKKGKEKQGATQNYLEIYAKDSTYNKYLNSDVHNYNLVSLYRSCQTKYHEGQKSSKEEVMDLFNEISGEAKNSNYRVGITCAPERREDEHDANFLAVIDCPSVDKANELEKLASEYGFDAGMHVGNVHLSKSKKVYIFKK